VTAKRLRLRCEQLGGAPEAAVGRAVEDFDGDEVSRARAQRGGHVQAEALVPADLAEVVRPPSSWGRTGLPILPNKNLTNSLQRCNMILARMFFENLFGKIGKN